MRTGVENRVRKRSREERRAENSRGKEKRGEKGRGKERRGEQRRREQRKTKNEEDRTEKEGGRGEFRGGVASVTIEKETHTNSNQEILRSKSLKQKVYFHGHG